MDMDLPSSASRNQRNRLLEPGPRTGTMRSRFIYTVSSLEPISKSHHCPPSCCSSRTPRSSALTFTSTVTISSRRASFRPFPSSSHQVRQPHRLGIGAPGAAPQLQRSLELDAHRALRTIAHSAVLTCQPLHIESGPSFRSLALNCLSATRTLLALTKPIETIFFIVCQFITRVVIGRSKCTDQESLHSTENLPYLPEVLLGKVHEYFCQ